MKNLTVIGTGYVGLVTGTCFADLGNQVICVDNNPKKLAALNTNQVPFFEPGLEERITRNRRSNRLHFTDNLSHAITNSSIIFIAVGTPPKPNGEADLSAVFTVVQSIIDILKTTAQNTLKVIVTKSTVPVGTGAKIEALISDANVPHLAVVSNPEFLREGTAIHDFFHPDRIVIGSNHAKALDIMSELYNPLYRNETPIVKTNLETSELSKYASNAFLATKISFINEMANISEKVGADIKTISKIMGMDGRIGRYFLHAGPGYGGSCFPKDTQALIKIAEAVDYDLKIVKAVETVNTAQKQIAAQKLKDYFQGLLKGKTIGILGLAFKPNTDDIRESAALTLIDTLLTEQATVRVFDPEATPNVQQLYQDKLTYTNSPYECAEKADAIILVTEWNVLRELDLNALKSKMNGNCFLDLRNIYKEAEMQSAGLELLGIGRPNKSHVRHA